MVDSMEMDILGCTSMCEEYCQPAVDLLLTDGRKVLYIVIAMAILIAVLAWNLYYYKKLYYEATKK